MDEKQIEEILARLERLEAVLELDEDGPEGPLDARERDCGGPDWNERRMVDLIVRLVSERVEELLDRRCDCHRGHDRHGDRRDGWDRRDHEPRREGPHLDEHRLVDLVTRLVSDRIERVIAERLEKLDVTGPGE